MMKTCFIIMAVAMEGSTGCGRLCSACLPDLRDHLARRR
jgi:hypothetical protein